LLIRRKNIGRIYLWAVPGLTYDKHAISVMRYPHQPFLVRIWELRRNLNAYDAAYIALAEALRAPLVTCDRALASAPGHRAIVEVIA